MKKNFPYLMYLCIIRTFLYDFRSHPKSKCIRGNSFACHTENQFEFVFWQTCLSIELLHQNLLVLLLLSNSIEYSQTRNCQQYQLNSKHLDISMNCRRAHCMKILQTMKNLININFTLYHYLLDSSNLQLELQ